MTPANLPSGVHAFFERYAALARQSAPAPLAALYGPSFLVAGPQGSRTFANDERFLDWLTEVQRFNEAQGLQSMEVLAVDARPLSPIHVLATVTWGARFTATGSGRIDFRIAYLLEQSGDGWTILAYVSEADQEAAMKGEA